MMHQTVNLINQQNIYLPIILFTELSSLLFEIDFCKHSHQIQNNMTRSINPMQISFRPLSHDYINNLIELSSAILIERRLQLKLLIDMKLDGKN
jgi:hypothetical protein